MKAALMIKYCSSSGSDGTCSDGSSSSSRSRSSSRSGSNSGGSYSDFETIEDQLFIQRILTTAAPGIIVMPMLLEMMFSPHSERLSCSVKAL